MSARDSRDLVVGTLWIAAGIAAMALSWFIAQSAGTVRFIVPFGPVFYGLTRVRRGMRRGMDRRAAGVGPWSLPFVLALRYLRASSHRTIWLYAIPFGILFVVGLIYTTDLIPKLMHDPKWVGLHAEWARAIGNAKWIGWVVFVLVFLFIVAVRSLTIFTTFSTYGMFVGCAALVTVLAVMSGFESDIKQKILGTHAHVVVTRVDEAFTDFPARLAEVRSTPGVLGVSPVLSSEAMIASAANRSNVVVQGIDPATIGSVTDLSRNMEVGDLDSLSHPERIKSPIESDEDRDDEDGDLRIHAVPPKRPAAEIAQRSPPGIVIGRELSKSLHVYLGDDVSMVSPTGGIGPSGAVPKARPYRVAGIFYSGMFEYDSKFVYVDLPSAQKLFDQPDEVSDLEVKVPDPDRTAAVVAALQRRLGPGYEVADWKTLNQSLFSALALEKVVMFVFLSFIILVAAFSIVANGQMIATQKVGEIAILKSMGATDGMIASAFVLLGAVLGILGVLTGVCAGVGLVYALQRWGYALDPDVFYMTRLPVSLEPREIAAVCAAGVVVAILATLQPAWRAARMNPIEGLREGGH
jgi:lipoprotein-releasing system permease protein